MVGAFRLYGCDVLRHNPTLDKSEELCYNKDTKDERKYIQMKKGDIYFANLDGTIGSEQGGGRPVVIIQNNKGNDHAPTVIVAAMTSKNKPSLPTHVVVKESVKVTSLVLCEQIRTIDKSRLERKLGSVSEETLKKIDRAMMISLGIVR